MIYLLFITNILTMGLLWLAIFRIRKLERNRPTFTASVSVQRTQRVVEERNTLTDDVISALMNLGYKKARAQRAVADVVGNGWTDFEGLFRAALRRVS